MSSRVGARTGPPTLSPPLTAPSSLIVSSRISWLMVILIIKRACEPHQRPPTFLLEHQEPREGRVSSCPEVRIWVGICFRSSGLHRRLSDLTHCRAVRDFCRSCSFPCFPGKDHSSARGDRD